MSELRSPAYWVGHIMAIVATIVGVYYAAVVGLEGGLELEAVRSDRNTYYVSESVYKELEYNIQNLNTFIDLFDKKKFGREAAGRIRFNDFMFQSARSSEAIFEIEPQLISAVSHYYFTIMGLIEDYQNNNLHYSILIIRIKEETNAFKTNKIMERLAMYNKALAKSVEDRGVSLTQPITNI